MYCAYISFIYIEPKEELYPKTNTIPQMVTLFYVSSHRIYSLKNLALLNFEGHF